LPSILIRKAFWTALSSALADIPDAAHAIAATMAVFVHSLLFKISLS
jgi:hypothetical protein